MKTYKNKRVNELTKYSFIKMFFFAVILLQFSACEKEFLDIKPDKTIIIPATLEDAQSLLNNFLVMNTRSVRQPETASDNFSMTWANYNSQSSFYLRYFDWNGETPSNAGEWSLYETVFYANTVLKTLGELNPENPKEQTDWNSIKGAALFFRAFAFYQLAQVYALPYDEATANQDLGIPLRLDPDINIESTRASVQETYDQIIDDLNQALELLPETSAHQTQPGKAAAYGLLARTYLVMRKYPQALTNTSNALDIQNTLMDYNQITSFSTESVTFDNPEVIFFHSAGGNGLMYIWGQGTINPELFNMYDTTDLRPGLFFSSDAGIGPQMIGSYTGEYWNVFDGLAVDELYLTRAECYARDGNKDAALADLNTLLRKRHDSNFIDIGATSADEALDIILLERRKELIYRGIRWSDIRRLNKEPEHAITLKRTFPDNPSVTIELPPNDLRFAFLIPEDVIKRSNLQQNPR